MSIEQRIARFQGLKEKFPDSEMPRWSLATTFEDAQRWDEAATELRDLVAIKPDYCVAWLHLGSCLLELERYEEAIGALEEAHRLAIAQGHMAPKQEAEMLLERAREEM